MLVAHRHEVRLHLPAVEQVVLVMDADEAAQIAPVTGPHGFDDFPRTEVAAADVANLATAHQIIEGAQCFVEGVSGSKERSR